jgi:hypothetical protein
MVQFDFSERIFPCGLNTGFQLSPALCGTNLQRTDSLQRICVLLLVAIVCVLEGNVNVLKYLLRSKGLDLGYFVSALNI